MAITKEISQLEHSAVKLTVTIPKKEVAEGYGALVQKYGKSIQIPGFRKGHVPISVLERKYGEALKADACGDLIEKTLTDIFEDKKFEAQPLPYSQPTMDEAPKLDLETDLQFSVTYDVQPKVTVTDFSGIKIEVPQVTVGKKELDKELKDIQERNALVVEKKDGEPAAKDDIITVNYGELDAEGNIIENSRRQDFVFTLGSGQNIYKFDDELTGMKKGESKDITKKYDKDFEDRELAGTTKKLQVTVTAIKVRDLPALDDELAQDVNDKYKTLDDLKADIQKNLETALSNRLRELKTNALLEKLTEKYPIDLPKSMVAVELESRWRMMAQQFQTTPEQLEKIIISTEKTKASMLEEWREISEKALKSRIIVDSLLEEKNFSVTSEETEAEFARIAGEAGVKVEEVKKYYGDPSKIQYLIEDLKERKLYDDLFTRVEVTKGEKKAFADLFKNS